VGSREVAVRSDWPAVWYTAAKFILLRANELDKEAVWTPYVTSGAAGYQYEWWPPPRAPHYLALVAFLLTENYQGGL